MYLCMIFALYKFSCKTSDTNFKSKNFIIFLLMSSDFIKFNSLWPIDAIWRLRSGSTLAQVMACCWKAPGHYLNQCWPISKVVLWHLSDNNFTRSAHDTGDVGCSAMWTWRESRVTKIWGSEHDHGFVLFLFATTGFHIARSGIFWTPTFVL